MVTSAPDQRAALEAEFLHRADDPSHRRALRRLLETRAQDADEYLGASAEAARHYLSILSAHTPG